MAVSSGTSCILSLVISILLFSGMQTYRFWLASSQIHTLLGGYLGSILFVFILTTLGNIENVLFGKSFQTKLFPEAIFCMLTAMFACGMIHRVCTTTCFFFSIIALYYVNQKSQQVYAVPVPVQVQQIRKKK